MRAQQLLRQKKVNESVLLNSSEQSNEYGLSHGRFSSTQLNQMATVDVLDEYILTRDRMVREGQSKYRGYASDLVNALSLRGYSGSTLTEMANLRRSEILNMEMDELHGIARTVRYEADTMPIIIKKSASMLKTMDVDALLEEYALLDTAQKANEMAQQSQRGQRVGYSPATYATTFDVVDAFSEDRQTKRLRAKQAKENGEEPESDDYMEQLKQELYSRGYTDELLERNANAYRASAMECSLSACKGTAINVRMLAAMNDATQWGLYRYMIMSDSERESQVRFKSVLDGPVQGVNSSTMESLSLGGGTGNTRWDKAFTTDDPLIPADKTGMVSMDATASWVSGDYKKLYDGVVAGEVQTDGNYNHHWELVTVLNPGEETECKIYRSPDWVSIVPPHKNMMLCKSEYLGDFKYDPGTWAIGYKEVPGTEDENADGKLTKVPVLRYIGELEYSPRRSREARSATVVGGAIASKGEVWDGGIAGRIMQDLTGNEIATGPIEWAQVYIPEGVKNLDYTFEGVENLQLIPEIPSTVTSMHCTFKDCKDLWEASSDFTEDDGTWKWPEGLKDASYTFMGCEELESTHVGNMPNELLTVEGLWYGCAKMEEAKLWNGCLNIDVLKSKIMDDEVPARWSDSPFLMDEFQQTVDGNSSQTMKTRQLEEEQKLREFHVEYERPENVAQLSDADKVKLEDAKAGNAAERTQKVLDKKTAIRSLDTIPINNPEENAWAALLQRGVIDVVTFAGVDLITKKLTGSKVAGIAAGIGVTAGLRWMDILPKSFEPLLNWVNNNLIKEGAIHDKMNDFIKFIHVPQKEDYEKAEAEQMAVYKSWALDDSLDRSVWTAGSLYDENQVYDYMKANGQIISENGVFQQVGKEGRTGAGCVSEIVRPSLTQAEDVFTKKMQATASTNGVDGEGVDWNEEMRNYYWQLMYGLQGYNEGALVGIDKKYSSVKEIKDASTNKALAESGLAYVNCEYATAVMSSLMRMDSKYHFMREEDWQKMDSLAFVGVDGLSSFYDGKYTEPTTDVHGITAQMLAERGIRTESSRTATGWTPIHPEDVETEANAGNGTSREKRVAAAEQRLLRNRTSIQTESQAMLE